MGQDLKGSVVNGCPVDIQSRTLSEAAAESKSCFLYLFEIKERGVTPSL